MFECRLKRTEGTCACWCLNALISCEHWSIDRSTHASTALSLAWHACKRRAQVTSRPVLHTSQALRVDGALTRARGRTWQAARASVRRRAERSSTDSLPAEVGSRSLRLAARRGAEAALASRTTRATISWQWLDFFSPLVQNKTFVCMHVYIYVRRRMYLCNTKTTGSLSLFLFNWNQKQLKRKKER
jgi:hypothetical protein